MTIDFTKGTDVGTDSFMDKIIKTVSVDELGAFNLKGVDGKRYKLNYKDNTSLYRFVADNDITQDVIYEDALCTILVVKRIP